MAENGSKRWVPIESNPEVMNKFLSNVGVPEKWSISDVYGLDDELLAMIPNPALALLLLFPLNEKTEAFLKDEEKKADSTALSHLYFSGQTIGNACGTIALIHAVSNNLDRITLKEGSCLKKFLDETLELNPQERAVQLEKDDSICAAHDESAQQGQTEAPNRDDEVNLHFVTIIQKDGHLYELDGRRKNPINHGASTSETFLQDAAKVCRNLMEVDPENVNFTVLALTGNE
uniref:Ubiquitin carboxyl-terminal hydrolase n=1 Tax=Lynceus sp. MCZ IZ 141354 TaxID=1930659 RepID=A0A9N6ZEN7_9CRUS|nr:EOG090X0A33 [Lynceus sp. MCZ IZ 141354]